MEWGCMTRAVAAWARRCLDFFEGAFTLLTDLGQLSLDLATVDHGQADGEVAFSHRELNDLECVDICYTLGR